MSSFFLFLEKYELTILVSMHKFTNEKKANNLSKQYFDYTLVCCRLRNTVEHVSNQDYLCEAEVVGCVG